MFIKTPKHVCHYTEYKICVCCASTRPDQHCVITKAPPPFRSLIHLDGGTHPWNKSLRNICRQSYNPQGEWNKLKCHQSKRWSKENKNQDNKWELKSIKRTDCSDTVRTCSPTEAHSLERRKRRQWLRWEEECMWSFLSPKNGRGLDVFRLCYLLYQHVQLECPMSK